MVAALPPELCVEPGVALADGVGTRRNLFIRRLDVVLAGGRAAHSFYV